MKLFLVVFLFLSSLSANASGLVGTVDNEGSDAAPKGEDAAIRDVRPEPYAGQQGPSETASPETKAAAARWKRLLKDCFPEAGKKSVECTDLKGPIVDAYFKGAIRNNDFADVKIEQVQKRRGYVNDRNSGSQYTFRYVEFDEQLGKELGVGGLGCRTTPDNPGRFNCKVGSAKEAKSYLWGE